MRQSRASTGQGHDDRGDEPSQLDACRADGQRPAAAVYEPLVYRCVGDERAEERPADQADHQMQGPEQPHCGLEGKAMQAESSLQRAGQNGEPGTMAVDDADGCLADAEECELHEDGGCNHPPAVEEAGR